jgi:hypothetical protein
MGTVGFLSFPMAGLQRRIRGFPLRAFGYESRIAKSVCRETCSYRLSSRARF